MTCVYYLAAAALVLLAGCGNRNSHPPLPQAGTAGVCTDNYVYGVQIVLQDAEGKPIQNGKLTLMDHHYSERLKKIAPTPGNPVVTYEGAGERPGMYTLSVEAPGFVSDNEVLIVKRDVCHVDAVSRVVTLQTTPTKNS